MVSSFNFKEIKHDTVIFVLPSQKYSIFLQKIISLNRKSCIILLNKNYNSIYTELKKSRINVDKILFIDCLTKIEIKEREFVNNVTFVPSPRSYTDISIAVEKAFQKGAENIILDSLSTLLLIDEPDMTYRFIQNIVSFVKRRNKKFFLTLLEQDLAKNEVKRVSTLVEKIAQVNEKLIPAKEEAIQLVHNLFGPRAGRMMELSAPKNTKSLLKELRSTLSKLVGSEIADKQIKELSEKYLQHG